MIVFGALVVRHYHLLEKMLLSVERGDISPDQYVIVDNGGQPDRAFEAVKKAGVEGRARMLYRSRNIGVSAGFNLILDYVAPDDLLVIGNDDLELGDKVLGTVVSALREADLVLAPGFLLFGARPCVLVGRVGYFDENLYPAYFEDCDLHYRAKQAGIRINPTPPVQLREAKDFAEEPTGNIVKHQGSASLRSLTWPQQIAFSKRFVENGEYYKRKWGGGPSEETHREPFGGAVPDGWQGRPITEGGVVPDEPWLRA